jgi:glycosyltransferase involved in cell wall biosynthesis
MKLSVTIAVKNEERKIKDCLESIKWADEIVVYDDASEDRTVEICKRYTNNIFINDSKGDFHINKNLAIDKAAGEWILSIDADEIIPPELAEEIRSVINTPNNNMLGYILNRRNYFLGKWIRGCGWYPDPIIRLFRKGATVWPTSKQGIHNTPKINDKSRVGCFTNDFIHYSYYSFEQYFDKFNLYTTQLAIEQQYKGNIITPMNFLKHFFFKPCLYFLRKYFLLGGYKDGFRGFFISLSSGFVYFVTYTKLWGMQNKV